MQRGIISRSELLFGIAVEIKHPKMAIESYSPSAGKFSTLYVQHNVVQTHFQQGLPSTGRVRSVCCFLPTVAVSAS
jgi:hypothetical protein